MMKDHVALSKHAESSIVDEIALPLAHSRFIELVGISPMTAWRWEKTGLLKTIRIAGRKYITASARAEFNRRVETGEFAGKTQSPLENLKKARAVG